MTQPGKDRDEALATAGRLSGALEGMSAELERLNAYGHRNRRLIWLTMVSLAIDVVVTVIVAVFAVQAHEANTTATANHAANVTACRGSNVIRAGELQLWDRLYAASTKGHETAKQRRANAELIAYIRHLFRQKNCTAAYRVP